MSDVERERLLRRYARYAASMGRDEASRALVAEGVPPRVVSELEREYAERMGPLTMGRGLVTSGLEGWLDDRMRSIHARPRWAYTRERLGIPRDALDEVDCTTDEILAGLADPRGAVIDTRGLVMGYVQSGKTTNFTALAAKAADAGYHLIIILSGIHTSLRRQTQERVQECLFHREDMWWSGTSHGDFEAGDGVSLASALRGTGTRGLLVVKKNAVRLRNVADWLWSASAGTRASTAVLIIDDEADQAGLDVSPGPELAGVHRELMRIANLGDGADERNPGRPRCAYVGYTATPYANVLTRTEEENLYPRHFIYPLPKPAGHVGPQELFGDKVVGRPVHVVRDAPGPTSSGRWELGRDLEEALDWFVLATAARAAMAGRLELLHSTMLIHTGMTTDEHEALRAPVQTYLTHLRDRLGQRDTQADLRRRYEDELARVPAEGCGERLVAWGELAPFLEPVVTRLVDRTPAGPEFDEDGRRLRAHSGVIVDNSRENDIDRLTYSSLARGQDGVVVVAIGGNTLSRGLTLEGLTVSFFARLTGFYDSLMQMGRWFGFRPGYRHLTRLWTTAELLERFRDLTEVEQEFRDELDWMIEQGLSPGDYGPRIRLRPGMNVTRPSAIKAAVRARSYSGYLASTTRLLTDLDTLLRNQKVVRHFICQVRGFTTLGHSPNLLATGVPARLITELLGDFTFHPDDFRMDGAAIRAYMRRQKDLESWNVVVRSVRKGPSTFDLGGEVGTVQTIVRSKVREGVRTGAYIKTLTDPGDSRIDLGASGDGKRLPGEPPLLCLYCLDAESRPRRDSPASAEEREALGAPTTVMALALVFPEAPEPPTIQSTIGLT